MFKVHSLLLKQNLTVYNSAKKQDFIVHRSVEETECSRFMSSSLTSKVHGTKYSEFIALVCNQLCTVSPLHCYLMEYLQFIAILWYISSSLLCYLIGYWNCIVAKFYPEIYYFRFVWLKVLLLIKYFKFIGSKSWVCANYSKFMWLKHCC